VHLLREFPAAELAAEGFLALPLGVDFVVGRQLRPVEEHAAAPSNLAREHVQRVFFQHVLD